MRRPASRIRQDNLRALIDKFARDEQTQIERSGGTAFAYFCKHLGYSQSFVTSLRNGNKNIGNNVAGWIEQRLDKPNGWMDTAHRDEEEPHRDEEEAQQFAQGMLTLMARLDHWLHRGVG